MFATLFRLISYVILAGGLIVAIVDATRSVAANALEWTDLGSTLQIYLPSWAEKLETAKTQLSGSQIFGWSPAGIIDVIKQIPLALLAAVVFLIIYSLASRNRAPRHF